MYSYLSGVWSQNRRHLWPARVVWTWLREQHARWSRPWQSNERHFFRPDKNRSECEGEGGGIERLMRGTFAPLISWRYRPFFPSHQFFDNIFKIFWWREIFFTPFPMAHPLTCAAQNCISAAASIGHPSVLRSIDWSWREIKDQWERGRGRERG